MYRFLFRAVALVGALIWVALLVKFLYLRLNYAQATVSIPENVAAQPSPTILPIPEIVEPTLEALPDTAAIGQGGAELPASANTPLGIHPKTGRYVAAWLPTSFDAEAARATFEANKDVLDEVSPFWYGVMSDGGIAADTGSRDRELVRIARENNVLIIPTIHNIGDAEAASVVISDPACAPATSRSSWTRSAPTSTMASTSTTKHFPPIWRTSSPRL
jgi:spore germination protein